MNIITGSARGTKLAALEGDATRPTLQRAKEVIFSAVQFDIEGRKVLDLFAGSGQLGLEALSRGAEKAVFIDNSKDAFSVIYANANKTHLYKKCVILTMDYAEYLRSAKKSGEKFDMVFLDPPYGSGILPEALSKLCIYNVLNENALVIAEWDKDTLFEEKPGLYDGYEILKIYKCGKIYFYKLQPKEKTL